MRNDVVLRTLLDHQRRILAHVADAEQLIDASGEPDPPTMACRRWQLARLLREYQIFKHHIIFDPVIAQADPVLAAEALRMKARCVAMGDTFRAHVLRWSNGAAAVRWRDYARAVVALIADLRLHMQREAAAMVALLSHPRYVAGR